MTPPSYAKKAPKLVGNRLILDFVNTVGWRGRPKDREERLTSYDELLFWAAHVGIYLQGEVQRMQADARSRPDVAERVLKDAIALRESFVRLVAEPEPTMRDVAVINETLKRAPMRVRVITPTRGGFRFFEDTGDKLERPLWILAWDAAALLAAGQRAWVKSCENQACGWMFLDKSLAGRRRWCSMDDCGNRAKARRHYLRQKKQKAVAPAKRA